MSSNVLGWLGVVGDISVGFNFSGLRNFQVPEIFRLRKIATSERWSISTWKHAYFTRYQNLRVIWPAYNNTSISVQPISSVLISGKFFFLRGLVVSSIFSLSTVTCFSGGRKPKKTQSSKFAETNARDKFAFKNLLDHRVPKRAGISNWTGKNHPNFQVRVLRQTYYR